MDPERQEELKLLVQDLRKDWSPYLHSDDKARQRRAADAIESLTFVLCKLELQLESYRAALKLE